MLVEDEEEFLTEENASLPPEALDQLIAGTLPPAWIRRRKEELLREAVRQDRPEALPRLLPKQRAISLEEFSDLLQAAEEQGSPELQAWLLQYRREHYRADEWETWEQRRADLELGLAEPTLAELKERYRVSFTEGGVCIGGPGKPLREYRIPAAVEGKPVLAVNAAAFYSLSPLPRIRRRFADAGIRNGEQACPGSWDASAGKGPAENREIRDLQPGDRVRLGRRAEKKNSPERPVLWRVIYREENRALLYCEEMVAALPYHPELAEVTWESSALRQWLNRIFLPLTFPPEERASILRVTVSTPDHAQFGASGGADTQDSLFLPSAEELAAWLPEAAQRAMGAWYWTRSPGFDNSFAVAVTPDGSISRMGTFVDADDYGVRPALWIRTGAGQ